MFVPSINRSFTGRTRPSILANRGLDSPQFMIHLDTPVTIEMANLVQQHGANPDRPSSDGSTLLGLASRMVWTDLVGHLLQSGSRKLGTRWCDIRTAAGCPVSIQVRILDQTLRSALGQASQLRD